MSAVKRRLAGAVQKGVRWVWLLQWVSALDKCMGIYGLSALVQLGGLAARWSLAAKPVLCITHCFRQFGRTCGIERNCGRVTLRRFVGRHNF